MNLNNFNEDLPHYNLTSSILGWCFDVINQLGTGLLEAVYKNALCVALQEKGLRVYLEESLNVYFRGKKGGVYKADIIVEKLAMVELKCCKSLLLEHQAQIINYLKTANVPAGLLVNFGQKKLEYKRVYHPSHDSVTESIFS